MPTSISPLTAENIIKANSGAYYLLHQDGGYTGNLNLTGPARIDNLNAGNAYVAGVLNVTGSQANFGNLTGFNFNHLARIVNTGDAYLRSVTGVATFNQIVATGRTKIDQIWDGLNISGDLGLVGDARMTGAVNITGTLFVNGQQITGVTQANQELVLTGSYASIYANKGDILIGTGNSGVSILPTGQNGYLMTVDTGSIYGYSFTNPATISAGGVNYLSQSSGTFNGGRAITVVPTGGSNGLSLNFDTIGTGSYIFGSKGSNNILNGMANAFLFGHNNSIIAQNPSDSNAIAMGRSNQVYGDCSIVLGKGNYVYNSGGACIGVNNTSYSGGFSIGEESMSLGIGHLAIGGGGFGGAIGSNQSNIYTFKTTTNGGTTGLLGRIPFYGVSSLYTTTFSCLISAIDADGTYGAGYRIDGVGKGGTLLGSISKTVLGEDDAGFDATINSNLEIIVTSNVGGDCNWSASCFVNQVGY